MTIYEPNPDVRPTGDEAGEFIDPDASQPDADAEDTAREDDREIEPSDARLYTSAPLDTEDGQTYVIEQRGKVARSEDTAVAGGTRVAM